MTTHIPPANTPPPGRFRILLKLLGIALCIALIVAYAASSTLLRIGTDKMIWAIARHNSSSGISQVKAWYKDVQYVFPTSISWTGVGGSFRLKSSSLGERAFMLKGKTATLTVTDLLQGDLMFSLESASLSSLQSLSNNRGNKFDRRSGTFLNGHVKHLSLPLTNFFEDPTHSVRRSFDGLSEIATGDSSSIPYKFNGVFQIELAGKSFPCTLQIQTRNTGHRLTIDESDLRRITNSLSPSDYSEEEINLIRDFPLRAPLLLHIKQYAKTRANELSEIDPDLPVDPYRHVLWSYLLTQSFGESFAKRVTDAHEVRQEVIAGSDSYKDYQNNDMGRQYATKGIPEQELAPLVKSDPLVRR